MMRIFSSAGLVFVAFLFVGCSSATRILIVNQSDSPVRLTMEIPRLATGRMIFSAFNFSLYSLRGDSIVFEDRNSLSAKATGDIHEVVLPAKTALQIGTLHNEKYKSSSQAYASGAVFNLKSIRSTGRIITPENFDQIFHKKSYGVVWLIDKSG